MKLYKIVHSFSEEEQKNLRNYLKQINCGSKGDKHEVFVWLVINNASQQWLLTCFILWIRICWMLCNDGKQGNMMSQENKN